MKIKIRHISSNSLAALFARFGFAFGIVIGGLGIVGSVTGFDDAIVRRFISGEGIALVVLSLAYPFISALFSAILGLLAAFIFNAAAEFTGGFELDIEQSKETAPKAEPVSVGNADKPRA